LLLLDFAEGALPKVIFSTSGHHAQQKKVSEAFLFGVFDDAAQILDVSYLRGSDVEPAQPVSFVGAGPQRGITRRVG
jgi:hypothetical protein